jgi:23S rRNA pseudouridine2605 synthase
VTSTPIRITKFLAECGECARRGAEELIHEGKVRVNGIVVKEFNTMVVPGRDNVQVGNRSIRMAEKGVILLHKPRGVVSTLSDPEGRKSVADYLTKHHQSYFPVGRLDYDSSGLLILTNDGDLANRLMHPRYGFERTYEVRVRGEVTEKTLRRLLHGMKIDDDFVKAIDVTVENTEEGQTELVIIVGEGKNRMVRKMFDGVGHPVVRLKRIQHGPVKLGTLAGGQLKKLTQGEYLALRKKVFTELEEGKKPAVKKAEAPVRAAKPKKTLKKNVRRRVRD